MQKPLAITAFWLSVCYNAECYGFRSARYVCSCKCNKITSLEICVHRQAKSGVKMSPSTVLYSNLNNNGITGAD